MGPSLAAVESWMDQEEETGDTRVVWLGADGIEYTVERSSHDAVTVKCEGAPVARVPVSSNLRRLRDATRAQLRAIVESALHKRSLNRWAGEGGSTRA